MIQGEAPVVLLDHREGRAQDIFFAEPQSLREALDKDGLARAELADQTEQLAAFEDRSKPASPRFRLVRRVALDDHRDHRFFGSRSVLSHSDYSISILAKLPS